MRRAILLLYAGLLVLIPAVAHAQLSSRANRNLETFFVAGSTGLGKAEDGAHTSGDTGVMVLCVRNDTHTTALSGTDGDYTPCATDSTGKIGIRGTFAEDAGHTSGDLGIHILTVRQDTAAALAGTDADYQPLITDASGRLHVNIGAINGATPLMGNGNTGTGSHRVTNADNDPCQTSGRAKSSAVVDVTVDTQIIALSGSTIIYVCSFSVSIGGTAPSFRFISGTGSVCATGITGRTGSYTPLTGSMITGGGGAATIFATAAGEALCLDLGGTSPSVLGYVSYVQQ